MSLDIGFLLFWVQRVFRGNNIHFFIIPYLSSINLPYPLIQRKGAALLDILLTSQKVLAPTYDNLIRWTESPGRYDLQGVDIAAKVKESVKARKVEKPSLFEMIGL